MPNLTLDRKACLRAEREKNPVQLKMWNMEITPSSHMIMLPLSRNKKGTE